MHYRTENVEFVNLCKGFQVLRDKKTVITCMLVLLWLFHGILSLTHYSTVQLKNKLLPSLEVEASSQEMSVPIYILLSTSFFFPCSLK